jgi:hypothetical protein
MGRHKVDAAELNARRDREQDDLRRFLNEYPVRVLDGGCWEWLGARYAKRDSGRLWLAKNVSTGPQRVTYTMLHGPVPPGWVVMRNHDVCDTRYCCNPRHWMKCRLADRSRLLARFGRTCSGAAMSATAKKAVLAKRTTKLSREMVMEIRASPVPGLHLAKKYGVSHQLISLVRRNEVWRDANVFSGLAR